MRAGACRVCGAEALLERDGYCIDEGACLARVRAVDALDDTLPSARAPTAGTPLSVTWRLVLAIASYAASAIGLHPVARELDAMLRVDARRR